MRGVLDSGGGSGQKEGELKVKNKQGQWIGRR
jgi:hypothetical protein